MNEVLEELRATVGREGVWGVPGGVSGVCLGGAGGMEVLCFRRWKEVWVETDDRVKGFRCDA